VAKISETARCRHWRACEKAALESKAVSSRIGIGDSISASKKNNQKNEMASAEENIVSKKNGFESNNTWHLSIWR